MSSPGINALPFADRMTIMVGVKLIETSMRVTELIELWRQNQLQANENIQIWNEVSGTPLRRWFSYTNLKEGWTLFGTQAGSRLTPSMISENYMLDTSELIRVGEGWVLDPENTFIQ